LGYTRQPQEARMMEIPGRGKSLTTSLAVYIQYMSVTDGGWTDRQTDRHWPTASHSKNALLLMRQFHSSKNVIKSVDNLSC